MADVFAMSMRLKEEGAAQVKAAIDKLGRSFTEATANAKSLDTGLGKLKGAFAAIGGAVAIGGAINKLITETSDAQFAQAQLNATLRSTAFAAGQSVAALNDQSAALAKLTVFEDDAITSAQSLLLTFTRIGGDTFPRATEAVLNVAQAMGTDLKSAAIQVGKALNDPIQGVSALARSGIQFTDSQKEMIATLVESGKLVEAQTIILKELETQFGGSAAAARNTLGGAIQGLKNDFNNLFEVAGDTSDVVVGINNIGKALQDLRSTMESGGWIPAIVREIGLMARAAVDTAKWFGLLGEQVDATGRIIDGVATIIKGVNNLSGATIDEGKAMVRAARDEYNALQARMGALINESRARESATRAMSRYKSVLDGLLGTATGVFGSGRGGAAGGGGGGGGGRRVPSLPAFNLSAVAASSVSGMAPDAVTAIAPGVLEQVQAQMNAMGDAINSAAANTLKTIQQSFAADIARTFADAISAGMQAAVANRSIGAGFKAFGVVLLAGIGDILVRFGTQALLMSKLMEAFYKKLPTNPAAAAGIALAMIAVGGALKGAATLAGSAGGGGGDRGSPMSFAAIGGGTTRLPGVTFGPTASATAGSLTAAAPINVTIIGPNDPSAQRQMQELIANASRRGNV